MSAGARKAFRAFGVNGEGRGPIPLRLVNGGIGGRVHNGDGRQLRNNALHGSRLGEVDEGPAAANNRVPASTTIARESARQLAPGADNKDRFVGHALHRLGATSHRLDRLARLGGQTTASADEGSKNTAFRVRDATNVRFADCRYFARMVPERILELKQSGKHLVDTLRHTSGRTIFLIVLNHPISV